MDPTTSTPSAPPSSCSPHARGWTQALDALLVLAELLPARAGMDPRCGHGARGMAPAPRTRGDGPSAWTLPGYARPSRARSCSPHARGWTRHGVAHRGSGGLLPARGGMDPGRPRPHTRGTAAPRTRGDGPAKSAAGVSVRGCSPHARGWTLAHVRVLFGGPLLPARAGMDPTPPSTSSCTGAAPRTRGAPPVPKTPTVLCTVAPSVGLPARPVPSPTPRSPSPREDEHRFRVLISA